MPIIQQKANTTQKMVNNIWQRVKDAQQGVKNAQQRVKNAQQGVVDAQKWVTDAQKWVVDAQRRAVDAQKRAVDAQKVVGNTRRLLGSAQQLVGSGQMVIRSAQQSVDSSQQLVGSGQMVIHSAQQEAETKTRAKAFAEGEVMLEVRIKALTEAEAELEAEGKALTEATAKAKAEIKALAEAEAEAEAIASRTTPLHDFATDCLRLSMHFFHPIQLCAQQVYHSALPLSPTSSQLQKYCLHNYMDKQLSHVAAFSGAPDTWGLLLRTIDIRPRQLTSITTSFQRIIAACEDIVNIYDAVTFVLQQSLCAPEMVTKIQNSPDGSTLFFAHCFSVTMWDVQTGGLIHTFTTQSKINDLVVSTMGNHIACGLSDGSVTFWDIHTKEGGKGFGNGQPVIAVHWLSPMVLVVATQRAVYVHDIVIDRTRHNLPTPGPVWGLVHSMDGCEFMVGTLQLDREANLEMYTLEATRYIRGHLNDWQQGASPTWKSPTPIPLKRLTCPVIVNNEIVCITLPSGVQLFNTDSHKWTNNPPLLDMAMSIAVSLNRNLVAQTQDSVQIFSLDVLKTDKAHNVIRPSYIYPLGEKHILCLQPDGHLSLLKLETLRELHPSANTLSLGTLLINQSPSAQVSASRGPVAELGVLMVLQAWQSGVPLPKWTATADEDEPLSGLSPNCTQVVMVCSSPQQPELLVKGVEDGITLAKVPLEYGDVGVGKVYDLTFDSETRFYLKAEGPGWHVQIPCDINASPSGDYSHTITQGEPEPLSEPRPTPPFTLDTNCEWIIDREFRKICWISPGNLRRGNGGHFWDGLSLIMLGDDGVVRKLTMKEPEC